MKYLLLIVSLLFSTLSYSGEGESGSQVESFKVLLDVELKNSAGNWISLYSGNEYLETVGTGTGTVSSITMTKPYNDTYTDLRLTLKGSQRKVKVVIGGITYYTQNQTITVEQTPYVMSTNLSDYGVVTKTGFSFVNELSFPTPLVVTSDQDINIVWIEKATDVVIFDGIDIQNTGWIGRDTLYRAFLSNIPKKSIQIPITYTQTNANVLENAATFFLDNAGNLIGGDCARPNNRAINCSMLKTGSLSNTQNNGTSGSFSLEYWDGDSNGYFTMTANYDCSTNSFSSLNISETGTVDKSHGVNDTLTINGTATCQDI